MNKIYETTCVVDKLWDTLRPRFLINGEYTSGVLKYFSAINGAKVKITIEVLEDESSDE